jgi:hypothetical protein
MKKKLYVAGILGCILLLVAVYQPLVQITSKSFDKSPEESTNNRPVLNYEQAAIPGLEVKTPAKVAVVNKLAVAEVKKNPKKVKEVVAKTAPRKTQKPDEIEPVMKKSDELLNDLLRKEIEAENLRPYVVSTKSASRKVKHNTEEPEVEIPQTILVNASPKREGRTVINYDTEETAINTSFTEPAEAAPVARKEKFPHDEEIEAPVMPEASSVNAEAIVANRSNIQFV